MLSLLKFNDPAAEDSTPQRRNPSRPVLVLASRLAEYPSGWATEFKSSTSDYKTAPLSRPREQPPRRSRWQSLAEPVIFAVALVAAVLAVSQWFNHAPPAVLGAPTQLAATVGPG